jgi:hypothetical protein
MKHKSILWKALFTVSALLLIHGCRDPFELTTRDFIELELLQYPESRVQDIYKSFCQDNLGPEHLIPDPTSAANYLKEELRTYQEDLDNLRYEAPVERYYYVGDQQRYARVDLSVVLDSLVTEEAFLDAFVRSANVGKRITEEEWANKWKKVAKILRKDFKDIPYLENDLHMLDSLMAEGHYIMHHSQAFRDAYHPHYRIIDMKIFVNEMKPLIEQW